MPKKKDAKDLIIEGDIVLSEDELRKIEKEFSEDEFENGDLDELSSFSVMPVIPLRGLSVFPGMVLHFDIGREKSVGALEQAMIRNQIVFLVAQKDAETDLPTADDFYKVGTIVKIKQMLKIQQGESIRVLVEGMSRGVLEEMLTEIPYFKAAIREVSEDDRELVIIPPNIEALMRIVLDNFEDYILISQKLPEDVIHAIAAIEQPGKLADVIATHMEMKPENKQFILEAFEPEIRLQILNDILAKEVEILKIEQDISRKVKSKINKNQREFYLREQMRTIREELGDEDEQIDDEIANWLKQLKVLKLSEKIHEKIEKEIKRLSKIQSSSAEGGVIRTYVEWVFQLPWNKYTEDELDLKAAEKILNEDHYGLVKVKERILEYLAVMELAKNKMKAPIICLVGPPGVGKTSVAKSIARAVGRTFVRMSLGGVRDEAEIRGHRRTYIGAIPGRIINGMKEAGTMNPVFLFDEIDKVGSDFRGDPASALLEVLDPEQNKDFTDHYLEFAFDLSKVLFITTANSLDTIPRPLLDRMEIIEVSGYTEEEKVNIAEKYLLPKQIDEHGLEDTEIKVPTRTVRAIINYYTRESGVRSLERMIGGICRKIARKVVEDKVVKVSVSEKSLTAYLGKKRFFYDEIVNEKLVGVTTGLAWTSVGGVTLPVETAVVPGTGKIVLTGQMGDVMKESASAGISYIRSISGELSIKSTFYKDDDIHIHIPEGATPKDGPSAGVAMFTAMVSMLTGIPARQDVAMTGEITLRGNVLPVGGVREKVLAAHRAGIRKVLLPEENERDIDEIPAKIRNQIEFVLIKQAQEALQHVLTKPAGAKKKAPSKKKPVAKKSTAKK